MSCAWVVPPTSYEGSDSHKSWALWVLVMIICSGFGVRSFRSACARVNAQAPRPPVGPLLPHSAREALKPTRNVITEWGATGLPRNVRKNASRAAVVARCDIPLPDYLLMMKWFRGMRQQVNRTTWIKCCRVCAIVQPFLILKLSSWQHIKKIAWIFLRDLVHGLSFTEVQVNWIYVVPD